LSCHFDNFIFDHGLGLGLQQLASALISVLSFWFRSHAFNIGRESFASFNIAVTEQCDC